MKPIEAFFQGQTGYDKIIACVQATAQVNNGKRPSASCKTVYTFAPDGKTPVLIEGLRWNAFNLAMRDGRHGLPKPGSAGYISGLGDLKKFMDGHKVSSGEESIPLPRSLTYGWIAACAEATKEYTGRGLTPDTKTVFARAANRPGFARVTGASGAKFDDWIANGKKGLPKPGEEGYIYGLAPVKRVFSPNLESGRGPTPG